MERQRLQRFIAAIAQIATIVIGVVDRPVLLFAERHLHFGLYAFNPRFVDVEVVNTGTRLPFTVFQPTKFG